MKKIFIDGSTGTTGLRIRERLAGRKDISVLVLPEELRKNDDARKEYINNSDISILCLPDDAAVQAVSLAGNPDTVLIDTSTAHRTNDSFVYGFPEICNNREKIRKSKRISNPGCHASGFISLVAPLIENSVIPKSAHLTCFSLTGYSGGGKKMISEYESSERNPLFDAPRMYGISQNHKHLPEMQKACSLDCPPIFCPIIAPYYSGMEVTVSLFRDEIQGSADSIREIYSDYYHSGLIHFENAADNFLSACEFSGFDDMEITVCGNGERILLVSRFDNLGKGASGSAIQNMNISLGIDETFGLNLKYKEKR